MKPIVLFLIILAAIIVAGLIFLFVGSAFVSLAGHKPKKRSKTAKAVETYYQPASYSEDSSYVEWGELPRGLHSNQVFHTVESAQTWLQQNGHSLSKYIVIAYSGDDIEDREYINTQP